MSTNNSSNKGKPFKHKQKYYPKQNKPKEQEVLPFDIKLIELSIEELTLSSSTIELLKKNRISVAADLCRRTEKDMYKIQSLNKKILLEVRNALKEKGMYLKGEMNLEVKEKPVQIEDKKTSKFAVSSKEVSKEEIESEDEVIEPVTTKLFEPLECSNWRKIQKGGKWGFYDGFKTVIPCMYDEVYGFVEGLCSVELDEKCGYIDTHNNIVIDFKYEMAMSFSEGFAVVEKGGKCGYINLKGEEVIPFIYDAATKFEEGEAKVKKDGKWGTIDTTGNVVWIK